MPIEVEDIQPTPPDNEEIATNSEEIATNSEEIATDIPANVASEAVPKKRGRPPGAKNKPKAVEAPPPVQPKKRQRVVVVQESESESEEELPQPPADPAARKQTQWAAYRQKQADAYQARQSHYMNALNKMLA